MAEHSGASPLALARASTDVDEYNSCLTHGAAKSHQQASKGRTKKRCQSMAFVSDHPREPMDKDGEDGGKAHADVDASAAAGRPV